MQIKGEKYIYLLMAYTLAKQRAKESGSPMRVNIGKDNGYKNGYMFSRVFSVVLYRGKEILTETKSSPNFADFSRSFQILNGDSESPSIYEYINEDGDNCSKHWRH